MTRFKEEAEELTCEKCNEEYFVWAADNNIWNETIRDDSGRDKFQFLCPNCFIILAEGKGVKTTCWRITTNEGIALAITKAERQALERGGAAVHDAVAEKMDSLNREITAKEMWAIVLSIYNSLKTEYEQKN